MREVIEKQGALLGLRLVVLIHRRQTSIGKLAQAAHVPLSTVQKIAAGKSVNPGAWTIARLARILGVSVDYVLGLEEDKRHQHDTTLSERHSDSHGAMEAVKEGPL